MRQRPAPAVVDDAAVIESSWRQPDRFAVLFDRHAPHIYRYLARRAGRQVADDLVAETFLAAFAKRHRYDLAHPDARPWLYGIATNLVGQHRRAEARRYQIRQAAAPEDAVPGHAERVAANVTAQAMRGHARRCAKSSPGQARQRRMRRSRPMNDMGLLYELAQETPLPSRAEFVTARARLAAAIAASPAPDRPMPKVPPPARPHRRRVQLRSRLALTAALVAAGSAVVTAVLVTVAGTPAGHAGPSVDTAAARVLHHAALAALQLQAGAPRPSQFVYTKIENGNGSLYQSWLSVDGTRTGLIRGAGGGPASIHVPGCRDGRQLRVRAPAAEGGTPGGQSCVPQPAYFPGMPASPRALRSYLERTRKITPGSPGYLNVY